jgi:hypothetical protein
MRTPEDSQVGQNMYCMFIIKKSEHQPKLYRDRKSDNKRQICILKEDAAI